MGVWIPHVPLCHRHAIRSCLRGRPLPHGHCGGSLRSCGLSHPKESQLPLLLGSCSSDLALLSGFIHAYGTAHGLPGPPGGRPADGCVWGVLGWPGAGSPHLLLFHSLLLLLCPTGCCLHFLLCHFLSAETQDDFELDSMHGAEICTGHLEQTEEEDLLPAAGVRSLLCLLLASFTGEQNMRLLVWRICKYMGI